jgi:hypothetical protein
MDNKKLLAKVYIDGANMFYTQKKLGWFFDWQKNKKPPRLLGAYCKTDYSVS